MLKAARIAAVLFLFAGLAIRAGIAPFHLVSVTASLGASPMGSGVMLGLTGAAALIAAIKVAAVLTPVSDTLSLYLEAIAAVAMVGGGAAALGVRAPRARLARLHRAVSANRETATMPAQNPPAIRSRARYL